MPKVLSKYDFSGGMNTEADPRDLTDQVSDAQNVMFDSPGKIRMMGQLASVELTPAVGTYLSGSAMYTQAAYGLMAVGVDYPISDYTVYEPRQVVLYGLGTGATIGYTDSTNDVGILGSIGGSNNGRLVGYYVDGAFHFSDATFKEGNESRRFDYVNMTLFGLTASPQNVQGWYSTNRIKPTRGIAGSAIGGIAAAGSSATRLISTRIQSWASVATNTYMIGIRAFPVYNIGYVKSQPTSTALITSNIGTTWAGHSYSIFPAPNGGFTLDVVPVTSGFSPVGAGGWNAGTYEYACSYVYTDGSESLLTEMDGTTTVASNDSILQAMVNLGYPYNEGVTGGRIYYREANLGDTWKLFVDINFMLGVRATMEESYSHSGKYSYTGVDSARSGAYYTSLAIINIKEPSLQTYESLSGLSQDETSISIQAKCYTVGANRAWAGAVRLVGADGVVTYYGDRIMYTLPNQYATWPSRNYLNLGLNDGDEFKALTFYADRLLAFKSNKMYIINVAQGADTSWFLESEHAGLGVAIPGSVYATDVGPVWVNENGCYLYDGEQIHNLMEKPILGRIERVISRSAWQSFITAYAVTGYDRKRRQIVILGDASSKAGTIYVYDLATKTWSKGDRFKKPSGTFTNFATYGDELIIGSHTT